MSDNNIFDNAIAFKISINRLGVRRQVQSSQMELKEGLGDQPLAENISISKTLIDCPEYDAVKSADTSLTNRIKKLALPSPFAAGTYLVPLALVERVDAMVESYKAERFALVQTFLDAYSGATQAARDQLGGLYNSTDYPSRERVETTFFVDTSYLELGTPGSLKSISPEIFAREREAFESQMQDAQSTIKDALRVGFSDLVAHMVDMLTPDPITGKPRRFFSSNLTNITEFMDTFSARNITGDAELGELIEKAKGILVGKTADEIKKSATVRESLNTAMSSVRTQLSTMTQARPSRKFSFSPTPAVPETSTQEIDGVTVSTNQETPAPAEADRLLETA